MAGIIGFGGNRPSPHTRESTPQVMLHATDPFPAHIGDQPALMLCKYPRYSSSPRTRGSTQGTTGTGFKRKPIRRNQPIRDCTLRHESDTFTPTRASTHGEYVAGAGSAEPPPKPRGSSHNPGRGQPRQSPNRGDHPQSAGEQFLPHAEINPIIPWTTPTPRTRGNQPYSGRTTKPQIANPCPHAGINLSHQNNPPRGRHIPPHTPGSTLPTLPARHRQPIPPHTRGSAVYLKETPASLTHSPSHAGIRPSHNPRPNPARHIPPHTREPIPRTRLPAP